MRIENGVYLGPLGALAFEGRFSMKKRILAFLFDKLKIKIGSLPHFTINIGKKEDEGRIPGNTDPFFIWFYADDEIIVAKGRGGGLAFWCRCRRVAKWFYLLIFYKWPILFQRQIGGHGNCIVSNSTKSSQKIPLLQFWDECEDLQFQRNIGVMWRKNWKGLLMLFHLFCSIHRCYACQTDEKFVDYTRSANKVCDLLQILLTLYFVQFQ